MFSESREETFSARASFIHKHLTGLWLCNHPAAVAAPWGVRTTWCISSRLHTPRLYSLISSSCCSNNRTVDCFSVRRSQSNVCRGNYHNVSSYSYKITFAVLFKKRESWHVFLNPVKTVILKVVSQFVKSFVGNPYYHFFISSSAVFLTWCPKRSFHKSVAEGTM